MPYRDTSKNKPISLFLIAGGITILTFMGFWMSGPLFEGIDLLKKGQTFGWALVGFAALGLIGVVPGLSILGTGIASLTGKTRSSVKLHGEWLIATEHFGRFRWKFKRRLKNTLALRLDTAIESDTGKPQRTGRKFAAATPAWLGLLNTNSIIAEFEEPSVKKQKLWIAPFYPDELLLQLAHELVNEINIRKQSGSIKLLTVGNSLTTDSNFKADVSATKATVIIEPADQPPRSPDKPSDCTIQVEQDQHQTVFRIPAKGVWTGTHGLFLFALIWNGFMVVFTTAFVSAAGVNGGIWFVLFIGMFWMIGIGLMLSSVQMGTRSVMIGQLDDHLVIARKSLLGTRWIEKPASDVTSIEVAASGLSVNDKTIMELQIEYSDGDSSKLLSQLADDELEWLAWQLKTVFGIETIRKTGSGDVELWQTALLHRNWPHPPVSDRLIEVESTASGFRLNVHGHGLRKAIPGLAGSLLIGAVGTVIPLFIYFLGSPDFILLLVATLFGLACTAFMIFTAIQHTRRYNFDCQPGRLVVTRRDFLFGSRILEFNADEISWIDLNDETGTRINERPINCLTICGTAGQRTLNALYGRTDKEILYVAALLNDTLSLPSSAEQ